MRITVMGWGNVGRSLGVGWARAQHAVSIATREPASERADAWRSEGWTVGSVEDLAADAYVLAMPGGAVAEVAGQHADALNGQLVIDTTNTLGSDGSLHRLPELTRALPQARLFRAFTTMAWENFVEPSINGRRLDQYYVGASALGSSDDRLVADLINDLGLNPIRLGDLEAVEHLDALTRTWFHMVWQLGYPRRTALTLTTMRPE